MCARRLHVCAFVMCCVCGEEGGCMCVQCCGEEVGCMCVMCCGEEVGCMCVHQNTVHSLYRGELDLENHTHTHCTHTHTHCTHTHTNTHTLPPTLLPHTQAHQNTHFTRANTNQNCFLQVLQKNCFLELFPSIFPPQIKTHHNCETHFEIPAVFFRCVKYKNESKKQEEFRSVFRFSKQASRFLLFVFQSVKNIRMN